MKKLCHDNNDFYLQLKTMSISKRQFTLLQEMGITVWQRRDLSSFNSPSSAAVNSVPTNTKAELTTTNATADTKRLQEPSSTANKPTVIDLNTLLKWSLFTDIIHCLGVSRTDLNIAQNQLDLGIINWQFTNKNCIEFEHSCLKTPDLATIANSVTLKKALWQSIAPLSCQ
ncbi:hypothetical protein SAMN05216262_10183 [Colwellia chukchiensis]|uniref:DNA polymerase III subunit psi n=1 Tax=Colwellia chukchiensis TaxID=641665 RepID=A0A1H7G3D2_9GAMM|nr:hypothetical protein [Colwellia chukchiensis]SEK32836.1 hypothetical protein SAMN05216262_10183 [Colwellia chukchiensis]